jgi:flagella basal body P-ring formation protein FlgA
MLRFQAMSLWLCVLHASLFSVFAAGLFGQVAIQMSDQPTNVIGSTVTLGDIATVRCDNPSIAAKLRKIDVEGFSKGQDSISISRDQVLIRIQLSGYQINTSDVIGADSVMVRRSVARGLRDSIQQAVQQQIVSQYGIAAQDLQVTVDPKYKSSTSIASFSSISVSPWLRPDLPLGRQSVTISATVANQVKNFNVPITVAVMRELAVASREINAGTELTPDDIRPVRRPISSKANRYLTVQQAMGQVAKNNIEKYGLVTPNLVRITNANDDVIIRRNAMINVVVERNGLSVTLRDAKAMSDGKRGGRIQVQNPNTGERMTALVVNSSTAKIY